MSTFKTKFNIDDTVYHILFKADINDADAENDLFETIMEGIKELKICGVYIENNIIQYKTKNKSGEFELFKENEIFKTKNEAYFSMITELREHLKDNLARVEELIKRI